MYKHEIHQIDIRDKNIVSYNKNKKWFITEYSDLHGAGIEPKKHHTSYMIFLWSEKHKLSICYYFNRHIMNDEEIAGDIFLPHFFEESDEDTFARELSFGTELHILND